MQAVCEKEEIGATEQVVDEIVAVADGSPREALVLLDLAAAVAGDEAKMLAVVRSGPMRTVPFDLAKALIFAPNKGQPAYWKSKVVPLLQQLEDDPEGVRQLILKFAETMTLKGQGRAAFVLYCFQEPVHYTGRPGLTLAAYRSLHDFEE